MVFPKVVVYPIVVGCSQTLAHECACKFVPSGTPSESARFSLSRICPPWSTKERNGQEDKARADAPWWVGRGETFNRIDGVLGDGVVHMHVRTLAPARLSMRSLVHSVQV